MVSPLFVFAALPSTPKEKDFAFDFGDFSTTEIVVRPLTARAKEHFGAACVSVNVRKSVGEAFANHLAALGFNV
jgi:hypothetical protein